MIKSSICTLNQYNFLHYDQVDDVKWILVVFLLLMVLKKHLLVNKKRQITKYLYFKVKKIKNGVILLKCDVFHIGKSFHLNKYI